MKQIFLIVCGLLLCVGCSSPEFQVAGFGIQKPLTMESGDAKGNDVVSLILANEVGQLKNEVADLKKKRECLCDKPKSAIKKEFDTKVTENQVNQNQSCDDGSCNLPQRGRIFGRFR